MTATTSIAATPYVELDVWDDESGERYFLTGHVPPRRAIAAVNRYVRECCGREDRADQLGDLTVADIHVGHVYWRPEPRPGDDEWMVRTVATDLWGKPFTEVSL